MPKKSNHSDSTHQRFFNNSQKETLFLYSNGKCSLCGKSLREGWHADHIIPYSEQGETDILNGQALCPECNLKKGNKMPLELRKWQKELEHEYRLVNQKDFLLTALPGAGKTIAAINIGWLLLEGRIVDGIIVVVPTEHLKKQWTEDAHKFFGIELLPEFITKDGVWPRDFNGLCLTYQQVARGSNIFRKICADRRVFAIFDEIHHCGDDPQKAWGSGLKNAFEYAARRLSLSGTPFRSDDNKIPFVRYIDGICHSDFSFDYPRAIHEEVIRIVAFEHYSGEMTWATKDGEIKSALFSDDLNNKDSRARLKTALDINGGWLSSLINSADQKLNELRSEDISTGGLIIAKDTTHAKFIAHEIESKIIPGLKPIVVTYEDNEASKKIALFRESNDRWIISVNMISEGVDIKRLRVLVYATNVSTELYFRQAIGRIVRYNGSDDNIAYCFLPSDPTLLEYSGKITELQLHAIESEDNTIEKEGESSSDNNGDGIKEIENIIPIHSSDATLDRVNIDGQEYHNEIIAKITPAAQKNKISPEVFLKALTELNIDINSLITPAKTSPVNNGRTPTKAEIVVSLRKKAHKMAYVLSKRINMSPKDINRRWVEMGGKYQGDNNQEDLQKKIVWLGEELDKSK